MYARVIKALSLLPAELASALKPIIEASDFDSTISPEQFELLLSTTQMTDTELRLALLPIAASYAVVPISISMSARLCVAHLVAFTLVRIWNLRTLAWVVLFMPSNQLLAMHGSKVKLALKMSPSITVRVVTVVSL